MPPSRPLCFSPLLGSLVALPPTRTVHNIVQRTRTSLCPGPVRRFAHDALQPLGHPGPSIVPPLVALCPLRASVSSLLLLPPLGRALSLPSPSCSVLPLLPLCLYPLGMMHDSVQHDTHLSYPRAGYFLVSLDACLARCLPPALQFCVERHVAGADKSLMCLSTPHSFAGHSYHAPAQVRGMARTIHDTLRGIPCAGPCTLPHSLFWSLALRVLCAPWPLYVCPLSPAHGTRQCAGHPLPPPCPCLPSPTLVGRFRFFSCSLPLYAHGAVHPRPLASLPFVVCALGVSWFALLSPVPRLCYPSPALDTLQASCTQVTLPSPPLLVFPRSPFSLFAPPLRFRPVGSSGPLALWCSLPCPFPLLTLCRTLCRHFARTLQACTWPSPLALDMWCRRSDSSRRLPTAATAPAGAAAAGGHSKCRGGRGPDRPRLPPGQGFTVPPAAPGRWGGSITKTCYTTKKIDTYIRTYIYTKMGHSDKRERNNTRKQCTSPPSRTAP